MPSILIGLGGIGTGVVRRVKRALKENQYYKQLIEQEKVLFCSLDVDPDYELRTISEPVDCVSEFRTLKPMDKLKSYIEDPDFSSWWIPGHKIYAPIAGDSGAGQVRINGRFAFYDNFPKISNFLRFQIDRASRVATNLRSKGGSDENCRVRIFVISSLVGGTGSGILVDTVHLIRSITDEEVRIYGILFDGSTIKELVKSDPIYTFAALTEIERWMKEPRMFIMKYSDGTRIQQDKAKFFDIVFIIQGRNISGRCFHGSPQDVKENFQTMAALFITSVVTIEDYEDFLEANEWNLYDNVRTTSKGRSCCYASFAVSQISFPVDKVVNYCYTRLISQKLKDGFGITYPDFYKIQKDLGICEHDGEQLTHALRQCPAGSQILEKGKEVIRSLSDKDVNNSKKFATTHQEIFARFSEWDRLISRYKSEMKEKLDEMKETTKASITNIVNGIIGSLKFKDIENILNEFKGAIEDNKKHVSENKKLWTKNDVLRKELEKRYDEVIKCKRGILGFGDEFPNKKQNFIETFNKWYNSELESAEHGLLLDFYNSLESHIDNLIWVVKYINDTFTSYVTKCAIESGKYVSKDWIISPERADVGDYLLNMEISTAKKDIDTRIYDGLLGLINDDLRRLLEDGVEGKFKGIKEVFSEILQNYSSNPAKIARRLNSDEEKGKMLSMWANIFENAIKTQISNRIKRIGVSEALEWFLDRIYGEIKSMKEQALPPSAEEDLKRRLERIFGERYVDFLLSDIQDFNKWRETAIKGVFEHVVMLTKPFIEVNEGLVQKIWEGHKDIKSEKLASVSLFVPKSFNYIDIIAHLNPTPTQFEDKFIVVAQYNFFPLHALSLVEATQAAYLKHVTDIYTRISNRQEISERPAHADVRYYTTWQDNIRVSVADEKPREKEAQILLLLGLGWNHIRRDGRIYRIYDNENKLYRSVKGIEGLYNSLKNQEISGFAGLIYNDFLAIYRQPDRIQQLIGIFKKAYQELNQIKMSKPKEGMPPTPSYTVWKKLMELSEVTIDNKPKGALVPRSETDVEELKIKLEEMIKIG